MRTRYIGIFLLLVSVPLIGFGCKGLSDAQQQAARPVSLEYWTVSEDVSMLRTFANEYRQFRPYVQIQIRPVREDQFADLFVNALADDRAPDIISIPVRELPAYQSRISTMPRSVEVANVYTTGGLSQQTVVEPVVNQMPTAQTIARSYIRAVEERAIIGNRVYGLPLAVDTMALYVNTEVLDSAGVPELPTTWDEFTEVVKKTTRFNAAGDIVQSGVALGTGDNIDHAFDIMSLLWVQNGIPLDTAGIAGLYVQRGQTVVDHPTFQSLRFYTDFAKADRDVYSWNSTFSSALDEFVRGRSALYIGFASDRTEIVRRAPQLGFEVVPLPQLDPTTPVNIIDFRLQSVVAKSPDQDEAWDFIRYITQSQNIERYLEATDLPTPLRSQITAQSENTTIAPFLEGILTATNWYQGTDSAAAEDALAVLLTRFVAPYGPDVDREDRDVSLLDTFVRTIQQSQ